jgi:hypothetical protein
VKYAGVYPGIDVVYYGKAGQLEYDFDIAPHSDASAIALNIAGADKITAGPDGSMALATAAGQVTWKKPLAYQDGINGRSLVSASYQVQGGRVGFKLGAYDHSRALVIDPVLVYGTYIDGANGFDDYTDLQVDAAGSVYVLGYTDSRFGAKCDHRGLYLFAEFPHHGARPKAKR